MVEAPQINHPLAVHAGQRRPEGLTVFLWGHPGTWKTTWAAGWPGVIFISISAEGGDDTLEVYPQMAQLMLERSQMPECPPVFNSTKPTKFPITSCEGFNEVVELICKNHRQWGICTVVVDGLCYLIDLWIDEYMGRPKQQKKADQAGGELMDPQAWGFLNMFLRSPRVKLQNVGLNVIWTTLQNDMYKTDPHNQAQQTLEKSLPMIQGQTKVKLPGACKLHINAAREKTLHPTAHGRYMINPVYWVTGDTATDLRHKYGWKFPAGKLQDPEFGDLPTFRAVWAELHEFIYIGQ